MGVAPASFEASFRSVQSPEFIDFIFNSINTPACQVAMISMILHVANYNWTARYEHRTHNITKWFGPKAVYYYAVYLILSALVRDHFIHLAVAPNAGSFVLFTSTVATSLGAFCFVAGALLNLWTLN
ncbi:hypothetical protein BGZ94_001953, partial [Podila epigama]